MRYTLKGMTFDNKRCWHTFQAANVHEAGLIAQDYAAHNDISRYAVMNHEGLTVIESVSHLYGYPVS